MNDITQAPRFQVRNPAFAERVRESFARQGAMALIDARLTQVSAGVCEITLEHRNDLTQQHGFFHGGMLTTVADTAAGFAAFTLCDAVATVLSVEFKVNFLTPADGERLIARGEVVKSGRTLSMVEVKVLVDKQGERSLCATMQQTVMNVYGQKEQR